MMFSKKKKHSLGGEEADYLRKRSDKEEKREKRDKEKSLGLGRRKGHRRIQSQGVPASNYLLQTSAPSSVVSSLRQSGEIKVKGSDSPSSSSYLGRTSAGQSGVVGPPTKHRRGGSAPYKELDSSSKRQYLLEARKKLLSTISDDEMKMMYPDAPTERTKYSVPQRKMSTPPMPNLKLERSTSSEYLDQKEKKKIISPRIITDSAKAAQEREMEKVKLSARRQTQEGNNNDKEREKRLIIDKNKLAQEARKVVQDRHVRHRLSKSESSSPHKTASSKKRDEISPREDGYESENSNENENQSESTSQDDSEDDSEVDSESEDDFDTEFESGDSEGSVTSDGQGKAQGKTKGHDQDYAMAAGSNHPKSKDAPALVVFPDWRGLEPNVDLTSCQPKSALGKYLLARWTKRQSNG